jgi:hypothetical protein
METIVGFAMKGQCGRFRYRLYLSLSLSRLIIPVIAVFWPRLVTAQPDIPIRPAPHMYGVIVGSNPGGAGQERLKFAEQDATRVAGLLGELGKYKSDDVRVLLHPEPEQVLGTLDSLAGSLRADRDAGEQAVLFFYYSGHARAKSINLGARELSLSELRERLLSLPTTLTVVVLDACQSGAFSRPKGAYPAADFSFNSVSRLNTSGIAVMASSSASELSQESDLLGASYFTHHLLVALRGGGDDNRDGRVSLDEAYRYAHDHTLADTSRTAVGGQHPTLQTDLTGRGDVPLSYPAEAKAQIELPKELSGQILIQKPSGGAVMAELYKASGRSLLLALPAGRYDLVLRESRDNRSPVRQCSIELSDDRVMSVSAEQCPVVTVATAQSKGTTAGVPSRDEGVSPSGTTYVYERWAVEFLAGAAYIGDDAYTKRLKEFDYYTTDMGEISYPKKVSGRLSLLGLYQINRYFGLALQAQALEFASSQRTFATYLANKPLTASDRLCWESYAITVMPRGTRSLLNGLAAIYGQLGIGLGFGFTHFSGTEGIGPETETDSYLGYRLAVGGGFQLNMWRYLGGFIDISYDYAPIIDNLMYETRNSGGLFIGAGLRARIWR